MPYPITSCASQLVNALRCATLLAAGLPVLLAASPAAAQSANACTIPFEEQRKLPPRDPSLPPIAPRAFELEAGKIRMNLEETGDTSMTGGVLIRSGERAVGADEAVYKSAQRALSVTGNVRYEGPQTQIGSSSADFDYGSGLINFANADFTIPKGNSRGNAGQLTIDELGQLRLKDVMYTTCPPGDPAWELRAGNISMNTQEGYGAARNVRLKFKGVPILYTPYLSFPIGNARKSGMLAPGIGSTGRSGTDINVPIYWNIAPNYDALLTPRLLTRRGMQMSTRFRYLTEHNRGQLDFEYLPNDKLTGTDRQLVTLQHKTLLDSGWRVSLDGRDASDSSYFEDLGGSLSAASTTHLDRSLRFDYAGDNWTLLGRVQDYQTIDTTIPDDLRPYQRMPQLLARGHWPDSRLGMNYKFDSELVYFNRDVGVTGWRFDATPLAELPLGNPGWFITPGVALEHTRYELNNTLPGEKKDPSRTLPISSLDAGLVFEKNISASRNWLHTIEPRILYVHVPYREQSDFPVFDTIMPDLNLVQLYRKNRFLGVDRVGDTDQVSIGITSRILQSNTGKQLVTATIGNALYLSSQGVALPGQTQSVNDSSDYIAEMGVHLFDKWNLNAGHQWSSGQSGTTQSQVRLQYRPAHNKLLNLEYRFRRDSLEQGDISWSWPLAQRWNFVGRYNYSLRDRATLERFFGLEYESCCWGLRLVTRRHISTRDGTVDSSIAFQLVLKGMTSVGDPADKLLERGILGYSPEID